MTRHRIDRFAPRTRESATTFAAGGRSNAAGRGRVRARLVLALCIALGSIAYLSWPERNGAVRAEQRSPPDAPRAHDELAETARQDGGRISAIRSNDTAVAGGAPATETRHPLRVRTVDTLDRPIPGARLFLRGDRGAEPIGTTDGLGVASVVLPDAHWLEVVARKEEFAATSAVVPQPATSECVLRLSPATTISGTVVTANKLAAGADVVVLALPERRMLAFHDAPERIWDEPEVVETRTDAQGKFTLRDLDPKKNYALVAGGRGFVQDGPVADVATGAKGVELVVWYGWAARIELRDEGGLSPRMSRVYGTGIGATAGLLPKEAHFVRHAKLYALLSGVPVDPEAKESDLVYVTGTPDTSTPVTVQLHMQPPGYALVRTDVPLTRLSEGMPTERITLLQLAVGFGTIEIERVGGRPNVLDDTRIGPFAELTLYREQGLPWHFPLFDTRLARQVVENVPFGRYRVVLRVFSSQALIPAAGEEPRFVEVGSDPVVLRCDGAALGAIEVDVAEADGSPHLGELMVFLGAGTFDPTRSGSEQEFNGEYLYFRRPPYVIDHLPSVPHTLAVDTSTPGHGWNHFDVEAGRTKTVRVLLPQRAH